MSHQPRKTATRSRSENVFGKQSGATYKVSNYFSPVSSSLSTISENASSAEGPPPLKKPRNDQPSKSSHSSSDEVISISSDKDSVTELETVAKKKTSAKNPFVKKSSNDFQDLKSSSPSKLLNSRDMRSGQRDIKRKALEEKKNIHPPKTRKKEVEMCPDIGIDVVDKPINREYTKPPAKIKNRSTSKSVKDEAPRRSNKTKMPSDLFEQREPGPQGKIYAIFNPPSKDKTAGISLSGTKEDLGKETKPEASSSVSKEETVTKENKSRSIMSDSEASDMVKRSQDSFKMPSPVKSTKVQSSLVNNGSSTSSNESGDPSLNSSESLSTRSLPEVDVKINNNLNQLIVQLNGSAAKNAAAEEKPKRKIIRRSNLLNSSDEQLEVMKKRCVGRVEIESSARVAFNQTYKDVETMLQLDQETQICPDYRAALKTHRQQLSNRYHVNFNFFLARTNQEIGALGSLRRMGLHYYPNAQDLHTILFKIIPETNDRVVLNRSLELLYQVLAMHPSGTTLMRSYYWSIMSSRYNEGNRWENLFSFLDGVLRSKDGDQIPSQLHLQQSPNREERRFVVLDFLVHVLLEDLRCWILVTENPSDALRARVDIPLVAQLLWQQAGTTIGHVSQACRDLIGLHIAALKSDHVAALSVTKPLMKMLIAVTKLSELQLPIKMRLPGEQMEKLAMEITLMTESSIVTNPLFFSSFGSSEIGLLLSQFIMRRLKPSVPILDKSRLTLASVLMHYLEMKTGDNSDVVDEDVVLVDRFKAQQPEVKRCILAGLQHYSKLFCVSNTWFYLLRKASSKHIIFEPPVHSLSTAAATPSVPPDTIFSTSFTSTRFVKDLKQTKRLFSGDSLYLSLCLIQFPF